MQKAKWLSYEFTVYTIDPTWNEVSGVYIFCGITVQNLWKALYVGKADSFKARLMASHEKWKPALELGASHVHALVVELAASRDKIERELILAYQPPLNIQLK
jgi:excinuclease UvrABC nuclease subunit